jgi:hypothetical protein
LCLIQHTNRDITDSLLCDFFLTILPTYHRLIISLEFVKTLCWRWSRNDSIAKSVHKVTRFATVECTSLTEKTFLKSYKQKNCNKLSPEVGKLKRYLLMNLSSERKIKKYKTMRHRILGKKGVKKYWPCNRRRNHVRI